VQPASTRRKRLYKTIADALLDAKQRGQHFISERKSKDLMLITLWITPRENAYVEIDQVALQQ
jgi:hypothetical protein